MDTNNNNDVINNEESFMPLEGADLYDQMYGTNIPTAEPPVMDNQQVSDIQAAYPEAVTVVNEAPVPEGTYTENMLPPETDGAHQKQRGVPLYDG